MMADSPRSFFAPLRELPICLCFLVACGDAPAPTAPDDAPVLESADVTSGGIGVLLSSDFREFQLAPAVDSTDRPEIVPNRWTNFAVTVDGVEVDSWRPEGRTDAIAFRVPLGHSGGLTVDVTGESVVDASLQAHRLGLVATFNYNHDCVDLETVHHEPSTILLLTNRLVELRADLVSLPTTCYEIVQSPDGVRTVVSGHAVLVPQRAGSLRFVAEGSNSYEFGDDPELRTWMSAAGGTFVDGQVLLERAAPPDSGPDVWRVRPASELEFVEPVSCPELPTIAFVLTELAPGLCLTFDGSGAVRRNGELVFEYTAPCCAWPALGFVVSSDGKSLLTGFEEFFGHVDLERLTPSSMPVFGADGSLLYEVDSYRAIYAAVFSPSGGELLVAGAVEDGEEFMPVIDRRDAATGDLILRRERPDWRNTRHLGNNDVRGARIVDGALWIATSGSEAGWQQPPAGLEIVELPSLETLRTIAVPADPVLYYGTHVGLYPGTLILPDPSGRRATLVSRWDGVDGLVGFTIDVYPD